jgi:hypothetical protein
MPKKKVDLSQFPVDGFPTKEPGGRKKLNKVAQQQSLFFFWLEIQNKCLS